jgi:site-specific DNA-adenine methylase
LDAQAAYCEPFAGGGVILLNKGKSSYEVYNDLDSRKVELFLAIRDNVNSLIADLKAWPYNEHTFQWAVTAPGPVAYFLANRMSRLGNCKNYDYSEAQRRGGESKSLVCLDNAIDNLAAISRRLQGVEIWNKDFRDCLAALPDSCCLYVDPPYPDITGRKRAYKHEMTSTEEHITLLGLLDRFSHVVVSTYPNCIYDIMLKDWQRVTVAVMNCNQNGAQECLFIKKPSTTGV